VQTYYPTHYDDAGAAEPAVDDPNAEAWPQTYRPPPDEHDTFGAGSPRL
jgi:hypothetical protein